MNFLSLLVIFSVLLFSITSGIFGNRQNCWKCASVNGCLAECNTIDPAPGVLKDTWSQCKLYCNANSAASSSSDICAIWISGERCRCVRNCIILKEMILIQ